MRRVPQDRPPVEQIAPVQVGQDNTTFEISNELLEVLTEPIGSRLPGRFLQVIPLGNPTSSKEPASIGSGLSVRTLILVTKNTYIIMAWW